METTTTTTSTATTNNAVKHTYFLAKKATYLPAKYQNLNEYATWQILKSNKAVRNITDSLNITAPMREVSDQEYAEITKIFEVKVLNYYNINGIAWVMLTVSYNGTVFAIAMVSQEKETRFYEPHQLEQLCDAVEKYKVENYTAPTMFPANYEAPEWFTAEHYMVLLMAKEDYGTFANNIAATLLRKNYYKASQKEANVMNNYAINILGKQLTFKNTY